MVEKECRDVIERVCERGWWVGVNEGADVDVDEDVGVRVEEEERKQKAKTKAHESSQVCGGGSSSGVQAGPATPQTNREFPAAGGGAGVGNAGMHETAWSSKST